MRQAGHVEVSQEPAILGRQGEVDSDAGILARS
jgi:hypothetical protein